MLFTGKEICSDADLFNCILFSTPVEIRMDGALETSTVVINDYNDEIIFVDGAYYFRFNIEILRKEVSSDADLHNCILFQTPVYIWSDALDVPIRAIITSYSEKIIHVGVQFYSRSDIQIIVA
ncbi:hypothetical protein [Paenibacillus sp. GP183]|uniref:hypothetical protein n=1 Tax=Paenibacillus sp. GP183 TaxID=1882751 RepID=UPI00089A58D2|nr:hypothetical protein [Paenibacillus sp. GP183]SED08496.1 hypothetical protein SAMN05443246_5636 [Paenibacillus sp. GP183]